MTLEDAVKILNDYRHHGHQGWHLCGQSPENWIIRGEDRYEFFEPFEAMAIAEKYVSDARKVDPLTKKRDQ